MTDATGKPSAFTFDEAKLRKSVPFELRKTAVHGVFTVPAPAAGFDPRTAGPDELKRAGILWDRADARANPVARATWERVMSRKWLAEDRVVPQFAATRRTHHHRSAPRRTTDGGFGDYNWAGAVLATGPWSSVVGTWKIPTISEPSEAPAADPAGFTGWHMSTWVGIDGYVPNNSNDCLQVGITQELDTYGNKSCYAWYEWWLQPPWPPYVPDYVSEFQILGFDVKPGHTVSCSAQYVTQVLPGPDYPPLGRPAGYIWIANETTGKHFPLVLVPPQGADFNGSSAEWIVEAPDGGIGVTSLPKFLPVAFTSALACSPQGLEGPWGDPANADWLNIENSSRTRLATTTVGNGTVTVKFTG